MNDLNQIGIAVLQETFEYGFTYYIIFLRAKILDRNSFINYDPEQKVIGKEILR